MSEADDHIAPQDEQKLVAAEYVLGVHDMTERRIVARRIERVPALAREVEDWEQRLGGLADRVAPVEPQPELWSRIESSIAGPATSATKPELWQSLAFWRNLAIGSALLAAASIATLAYVGFAPQRARADAGNLGSDEWTAGLRHRGKFGWPEPDDRAGCAAHLRPALDGIVADPRWRAPAFARADRTQPAGATHSAARVRWAADNRYDSRCVA